MKAIRFNKFDNLFFAIEDVFEKQGKEHGIEMIDVDCFYIKDYTIKLYHCKNTIFVDLIENKDNICIHRRIQIYYRNRDGFTGAIIMEGISGKKEIVPIFKYAGKKKFCEDLIPNVKKMFSLIGVSL